MNFRKYTEEQLIEAVKNSFSLREVLLKLNVNSAGGNYEVLKRAIKYLNCDISHFRGKGWLKGKNHTHTKRELSKILVYGKNENTHKLKLRLIKEGVKEHKCENCLITMWLNKETPLEFHHIDGNRKNNSLENIQLLCPNCHALTTNYCGKNMGCCP